MTSLGWCHICFHGHFVCCFGSTIASAHMETQTLTDKYLCDRTYHNFCFSVISCVRFPREFETFCMFRLHMERLQGEAGSDRFRLTNFRLDLLLQRIYVTWFFIIIIIIDKVDKQRSRKYSWVSLYTFFLSNVICVRMFLWFSGPHSDNAMFV